MNTLACKNCGSTQFRKENEKYICQHCGTTLVPKLKGFSNKRKKVITGLLVLLLIGLFLIYNVLYRVDKNIKDIKNKAPQVFNVEIQDSPSEEGTPFEELNALIKKKLQKELVAFPIEDILKKYNMQPTEKAFFISLNKKGKYAYGYMGGMGTIEEATKKAFEICEKERKLRKLDEVCMPYIINMHVSSMLTQ
jgi:ribosomal protein L37E